jgi:hypothetical protein
MAAFDPKRVLRQISNYLIHNLFQKEGQNVSITWDDLSETNVSPIFDAWQAMPERARRKVEIVLHEVDEMATEDGIRAIVEEANVGGDGQLVQNIDGFQSRHDKAVWTYLMSDAVWDTAVRFARADLLSRQRYWITRINIPRVSPRTDKAHLEELEVALAAYFVNTQARGRICRIEHYLRSGKQDYFFCYLEDYADTYINFDEQGEFARTPERRAFELVFVYDRDHGSLSMYARGGKKVNVDLQEIFCRVILDEELGLEDRSSQPYELNGLIKSSFALVTDPGDGINVVRVRRLRLSVKGQSRRRITLEADPEGPVDDIYRMMADYLDRSKIPTSIVNVTQAGLRFEFDGSDPERPKSMSFDVSHPNSSNLKSKPERLRELGEKYLKRWGIDRAEAIIESHAVG